MTTLSNGPAVRVAIPPDAAARKLPAVHRVYLPIEQGALYKAQVSA